MKKARAWEQRQPKISQSTLNPAKGKVRSKRAMKFFRSSSSSSDQSYPAQTATLSRLTSIDLTIDCASSDISNISRDSSVGSEKEVFTENSVNVGGVSGGGGGGGGGGGKGLDIRQCLANSKITFSPYNASPIPLNKEQLKKMRGFMVIGALLLAGCLLLLHLHVVDSLHSITTIEEFRAAFPHINVIPSNTLLVIDDPSSANIQEVGIPEAEIAQPVGKDMPEEGKEVEEAAVKPNASWCTYQDLKAALQATADGDKVFIQVIPDVEHIKLARNNLDTVYRRTGKRNLLFVCTNVEQCVVMPQHKIGCFIYEGGRDSAVPAFHMLYKALELKYRVAYMDFDSSVVTAPSFTQSGDMVIPYGNTPKACSFYISRNTPLTLDFHKIGLQAAKANPNRTFLSVFKAMLDRSLKKSLKLVTLANCTKFPDRLCSVLRHPHFSRPADRSLWLKEKQMWFYDDDKYYSSTQRQYISYENNIDMRKANQNYQLYALKNALAFGQILNRVVILPKFLCWKCTKGKCKSANCLLSGVVNMTAFDSVFDGLYREHSFKGHPFVPLSVKKNVSEMIMIASPLTNAMTVSGGIVLEPKVRVSRTIVPDDSTRGADSDEVLDLFEKYKDKRILQFVNLYGAFSGFNNAQQSVDFENKLKRGFPLV